MTETNNILSVLEGYSLNNPDDVAREIADDFRKRRIEKNLTREQVELTQIRRNQNKKKAHRE